MLRIGLTGGIASGKGEAARIFTTLDIPIIDADIIAHQLVAAGQPALTAIEKQLGHEYILDNGELNRSKLRKLIFAQEDKRKQLEAILHPLIRQQISRQLITLNAPYCILVIPLLFEADFIDLVDRSLVIDSNQATQLRRASQRDQTPEDHIQAIIDHQLPRQDRINLADDIIHNNADIAHLREQIEQLDKKYRSISKTA